MRWLFGMLLAVVACSGKSSDEERPPPSAASTPSVASDAARLADDAAEGTADAAGVVDAAGAGQFVDLKDIAPSIVLEMRYATVFNFTGVAVYPEARCLLRVEVAQKLAAVQVTLEEKALGLKVWDCYRPLSVQQKFWELVPDPRYVAKPIIKNGVFVAGSKHNRGAAVDLTLVDERGRPLDMPSEHDDFTARAHRNYHGASAKQQQNSAMLEAVMVEQGFEPLATEWWHFDGPNWRRYPLENRPLSLP